ncbi:MAG: hypothetical protein KIT43_02460 [Bauldia sp.]|nr:hypothetical protein [Bauldia sp.]
MNATVLDRVPMSGLYEEVSFAPEGHNDLAWILFENEAGDDWVGKFAGGFRGGDTSAAPVEGDVFFLLVKGSAYFVDARERRLLGKVDHPGSFAAYLVVPGGTLVAVTDGLGVSLLTPAGVEWDTGRFALDGVLLESATAAEVTGRYWHYAVGDDRLDWPWFRLSLDTRELQLERPDLAEHFRKT